MLPGDFLWVVTVGAFSQGTSFSVSFVPTYSSRWGEYMIVEDIIRETAVVVKVYSFEYPKHGECDSRLFPV